MIRPMFPMVIALMFLLPAGAKDIVVNDGFESVSWAHWTSSGNPFAQMIDYFNTSGNGASYCLGQMVHTGYSGGLTQEVFVVAGVTYDVTADFAYHNL